MMEQDHFNGMIEGQDIICFANDWDSDPLSKKHVMLRLAKRNRVLWINSIGMRNPQISARDFRRALHKLIKFANGCEQRAENLFLLSPLAIPFHGNRAAHWVNRHWLAWTIRRACRRLGFQNPITWTFLPNSADVAGELGERLLLYHCVDEYSEFTGSDKASLLEMEHRLMQKSDLVIVSSGLLYESKRGYNPNTFLVTHGVDVRHFRQACSPTTVVPQEIAALKTPVIGFHGLVADWVDLELIRFLALARPQWSFVLIGKVETDTEPLRGLANVHLLGRKSYDLLPSYCKGFHVGILPFARNELTRAANPLKLREYLAAGLPVVSTAIPEARRLGSLVRIGESSEHFLKQIETLLAEGRSGPSLSVSKALDSESWESKVAEMSQLITQLKTFGQRRNTKPLLRPALEQSWLGDS